MVVQSRRRQYRHSRLCQRWIYPRNNRFARQRRHHVAAVLDNDGLPDVSEIKLYVPDVEETTTYDAITINTGNILDVKIGVMASAYFTGRIDDVRIYDHALTQPEVAEPANP